MASIESDYGARGDATPREKSSPDQDSTQNGHHAPAGGQPDQSVNRYRISRNEERGRDTIRGSDTANPSFIVSRTPKGAL